MDGSDDSVGPAPGLLGVSEETAAHPALRATDRDSSGQDGSLPQGVFEAEGFVNKDVASLLAAWQNEKYAPELLPFCKDTVETMSEVVEFVGEGFEEELKDGQDPNDPDFRLRSFCRDRTKYVLRDYLRIRLWKLQQWPQHYLEPQNFSFLSKAEADFLHEMWKLKQQFFEHRLLGALPKPKQVLNEKLDLLDMVRRPCLDKFVYARILGEVGAIDVSQEYTQGSPGSLEPLVLHEGQTYLLKYSHVRKFLIDPEHAGKVQLV